MAESTAASVSRPAVCMSRHFDNVGRPRPPVAWAITYGCAAGHEVSTEVCDRCATSLTDGHQRCGRCFLPMTVSSLSPPASGEPGACTPDEFGPCSCGGCVL